MTSDGAARRRSAESAAPFALRVPGMSLAVTSLMNAVIAKSLTAVVLAIAASIAGANRSYAGEGIQSLCQPWIDSPCIARVGASLRSASSGKPLPGKTIRFVAGNTLICSSVTDTSGSTSCFGVAGSGRGLAESGYRIVFEGDDRFAGASVMTRAVIVRSGGERAGRGL